MTRLIFALGRQSSVGLSAIFIWISLLSFRLLYARHANFTCDCSRLPSPLGSKRLDNFLPEKKKSENNSSREINWLALNTIDPGSLFFYKELTSRQINIIKAKE